MLQKKLKKIYFLSIVVHKSLVFGGVLLPKVKQYKAAFKKGYILKVAKNV